MKSLVIVVVAIASVSASAEVPASEKKTVKRGIFHSHGASLGAGLSYNKDFGFSSGLSSVNGGYSSGSDYNAGYASGLGYNSYNLGAGSGLSSGVTIYRQIQVPVPVPVPHLVEVPHPVPVKVDRPYPVPVPQPYPVHVTRHVPVKVDRPYPVPVPLPVPVHILKPVDYPALATKPAPVNSGSNVYGASSSHGYFSTPGLETYATSFNNFRPKFDSKNQLNIGSSNFATSAGYLSVGNGLENRPDVTGLLAPANNIPSYNTGYDIANHAQSTISSGHSGYTYPAPLKKW